MSLEVELESTQDVQEKAARVQWTTAQTTAFAHYLVDYAQENNDVLPPFDNPVHVKNLQPLTGHKDKKQLNNKYNNKKNREYQNQKR